MVKDVNVGGGIGFFGLLCILFIGLKLTGLIDWSWFWVLFPITFPIVILVMVLAGCFIFACIKHWQTRNLRR